MEQIIVDNKHEYDYKLDDNHHELYYSDNDVWMSSGELALRITDDGNGLAVTTEDEKLVYLDYNTAEQLLVLLKLINREIIYEVVTKRERI
jgi:hypothetical protein